jgi:hypothetical protein
MLPAEFLIFKPITIQLFKLVIDPKVFEEAYRKKHPTNLKGWVFLFLLEFKLPVRNANGKPFLKQ